MKNFKMALARGLPIATKTAAARCDFVRVYFFIMLVRAAGVSYRLSSELGDADANLLWIVIHYFQFARSDFCAIDKHIDGIANL